MNYKSSSAILKSKLAILGFVFLIPLQSNAATSSTTMTVTATVLTACTLQTNPLVFGSYDTTAASDLTASTTVEVLCNGLSNAYTISMSTGLGANATFAARQLTAAGQSINYSIYTNANTSNVWGDGTSTTSIVSGSGTTGVVRSYPVYGKIFNNQPAAPGIYSDTVTVTLSY